MCQVHSEAYVSLLTPGETNYSDCHPRKTTTYILHVLIVSITTHTHDRRKSIGEKKQRKEKNIKERKEKGRKQNKTKKVCLSEHEYKARWLINLDIKRPYISVHRGSF